ncbi:MAG TPA: 3'-5' exonuclease, partial [Caulobacteraceae bacterium]
EVDNILRFERDFPGAKVIRLERNYRSTSHILAAASGLISANRDRLGKTLWTEAEGGTKVQVSGVWDGEAESRLVAEGIERWRRGGRRYRDTAILVRASFQMRAFEERFVLLQIPYTVVGGPRFFERAEIRDAHAYLRLVQSADDDLAFERIVNTPRRGLGESTVQKLLTLARERGVSASTAAADLAFSDELAPRTRTALSNFMRDLERWRGQIDTTHHARLTETILEESGYVDALRLDKGPTSQTRLENLKELVQSMGAFESLSAYLEHVSLVMDLDRGAGEDAVQIMTLHSAKGLEFPLVFLPGWEEGVFPSQRSLDESGTKGLEEERRLAYVGLTRAREEARVTFAANRQVYGRWTSQLPSRFVDELPAANVEASSETGYYGGGPGLREGPTRWDETNYGSGYDSPGWRRAQARGYAGGPPGRTQVIEGEGRLVAVSDSGSPSAYARGDRVFHQKFGYGKVMAVEGNKLTVAFDTAGEKRVIDSFLTAAG